jgi:hypothetical protein
VQLKQLNSFLKVFSQKHLVLPKNEKTLKKQAKSAAISLVSYAYLIDWKVATTFSTVKPNSSNTLFPGAEAPK